MNNGNVNGSAHVGGFVGLLYPNIEPNRVTVVMENSANKGTILSSSSMAWGFFFVVQGEGVEENINILISFLFILEFICGCRYGLWLE